MESFEFLGGRYNRPEQIMSGPMQAFRAQSAATGRTVFIHRVSTAEAPEEQASLLKLLTTALVKSSDAKRLVLDFGEERGYWYVVTESEPQCALLREWLQLEIDAAVVNARLALPGDASPAPAPKAAPALAAAPSQPPSTETGEFTRFIQTRAPFSQSPPPPRFTPPAPPAASVPPAQTAPSEPTGAGDFTRVFQSKPNPPNAPPPPPPVAPPPVQPAVQRSAPGEFTSLFNPGTAAGKSSPEQNAESARGVKNGPEVPPPLPATPPKPLPDQPAAGEFTRFFQAGLPPARTTPAPPRPPAVNQPEQSPNRPFVQRPNTPIPPIAALPPDNGEFTKLFSRPENAPPVLRPKSSSYQPPAQPSNDPFKFSHDAGPSGDSPTDDIFSNRIDIPQPIPPSQPQQGEFTRMFGAGGDAPPPVQRPTVTAAPPVKSPANDDRTSIMQPPSPPAAPSAEAAAGPGEFTRILQGPAKSPAAQAPNPASPPPAKDGPAVPLPKVNIAPVNPASALPHFGSHGASAGSAHASAGPSSASASSAVGSASINAPRVTLPPPKIPPPSIGGANKKMIILFSVLGVLAVILVLLMLFLMKK